MDDIVRRTHKHMFICNELNELFAHKNIDYGDSFHKTFAEEGWALPRLMLTFKLNRMKRLTKNVPEIKTENLRDTLIDIANYAIMSIIELDDEKERKTKYEQI